MLNKPNIRAKSRRHPIFTMLALLLSFFFTVTLAHAQTAIPRLAENAPDTYVVEQGDTLWDISALFLDEPWRWPELWSVNPDVRDPNVIYPGDVLYLRWNNDKPGVYLTSEPRAGVTKLSPTMRSESLTSAIPEIPRDVIDPFIANHRFETTVDRSAHPRVLGGAGGRLISGMGDSIYVAGNLSRGVETYDVLRPSQALTDPKTGESLGHLMMSVGRVALAQERANQDEASRFDVITAREELRVGDILFPVIDGEVVSLFKPRAPDRQLTSGVILSVDSGVSHIGALDVVATNLGHGDGVQVGHILGITKGADRIRDPETRDWLSIPAERAGTMMLFAVYEKASFGLIVGANQPLAVGDELINP